MQDVLLIGRRAPIGSESADKSSGDATSPYPPIKHRPEQSPAGCQYLPSDLSALCKHMSAVRRRNHF
ncbi:MAG TPA: hypothetical protein DEH07_09185 [Desulfotomaculum sp.]|nr:hypothetical protein [Desulfotomaculum sp.]